MATALYSYFAITATYAPIRGFFLCLLSGQKRKILKDPCWIVCKFFMHREYFWHMNSMQILLELQKSSTGGNKFKAKVRGIALR